MNDIVIKTETLGKKYVIGHQAETGRYVALRDVLMQNARTLWNKTKDLAKGKPIIQGNTLEEVWALKDVSFEIRRGEAVGIIGRNGAGKSTLLKILSRITEPSTGRVTIRGRVASLLEVGTGFHPELTGRENIYLNGAILGMTRGEIRRKFDEIVAFAEVEKYLDTPVKRYSSGMYVRLAFAVAAHLEPEILVVDEVLAVGDAEFQKKCLGKMENVSKGQGRTVLFVSHNMRAVKSLCNKGVLLEGGEKIIEGEITAVTDKYTNRISTQNAFTPFQIKAIDVVVAKITLNEENAGLVTPFKPLRIDIELDAEREIDNIGIEIMISHDDTNGVVFATNTKTRKNMDLRIKRGKNRVSCLIDSFNLCSGKYWLGFGIDIPFVMWYYYELALLHFDVTEVLPEPSRLPTLSAYGHVYLDHKWIYSN
jgi:lipopolysaccharide transport system ATP-binding protein